MNLETSLFKQEWRGGGGILVVDLCPRASPLRRRLLQRRHGAWEVVQERMQIVIYVGGIWKMVDRVLASWYVDDRCGFLLHRLSHVGVLGLKFDGVFGVLPRSNRSTVMVSPLASHLGGLQSCISAMEPRRVRV